MSSPHNKPGEDVVPEEQYAQETDGAAEDCEQWFRGNIPKAHSDPRAPVPHEQRMACAKARIGSVADPKNPAE